MGNIQDYMPLIIILFILSVFVGIILKIGPPPDIMLETYEDVARLDIGTIYTLKQKRANYWWTLLFGITTGDLNPIHINYFGAKKYKSNLGGLARHGVSMLADCEAQVFKIFGIRAPTEIIALGYDKIRYLAPCNIGTRFVYTYTLQESSLKNNNVRVKWLLQAKDANGKLLMEAYWNIMYAPVLINKKFGRVWNIIGGILTATVTIYLVLGTVALLLSWIYNLIASWMGWPLIHFFDNVDAGSGC